GRLAPDSNERAATLPRPLETGRGPRSACEPGLLQLQSPAFDRFPREKTPTTDTSYRATQAWGQAGPSWPSPGTLGADCIGVAVSQCLCLWFSWMVGDRPVPYASGHCITCYSPRSDALDAASRSMPVVRHAGQSVIALRASQRI